MTSHPYIKIDRRSTLFRERKKIVDNHIKTRGIKQAFKNWQEYAELSQDPSGKISDAEWYWLNKETIYYLTEVNTKKYINSRN